MTPKTILVTGATGVVGRPAMRRLVAAGHHVRAVARSDDKAAALRTLGATPVVVDLFDAAGVRAAVAGCDTVLHLATNVPPLRKASRPDAWATHNRLRTEATRHLVAAALDHDVETFVKESIVFVYPVGGAEWIDETTPPDPTRTWLAPTVEGEQLVDPISERGGRAVVLRFGLFYGPGNRATHEARRLARFRMSTFPGPPDAYLSMVHTEDAAAAVVEACTAAPSGVYNVCDDEPLTRRDHRAAFAAAFGYRRLYAAPGWLMRLVAGSAAGVLTSSQRCSNRRFRDATSWAPQYPDVRVGWRAVARADEHEANGNERGRA